MSTFRVEVGDCREVMAAMEPESVDAVVTDPPYGIAFMGKAWDYEVPGPEYFEATWRVLKDGGRLLCFGGPRTFHRMWSSIEGAGFTIEDTVMWMYGTGFPKHGSKLKPAYEPICVARKGGVTDLNIDACRIATDDDLNGGAYSENKRDDGEWGTLHRYTGKEYEQPEGRWPANVVLDKAAARMLDAQSGDAGGGYGVSGGDPDGKGIYNTGFPRGDGRMVSYGDAGGASRFFYCAKAGRAEREAGLEGMAAKPGGSTAKGFTDDVERGVDRNRPTLNPHPTVKPVDLMRWLVRLVTPAGGTVLDPFCGSGATGVACTLEGFDFIGVEKNEEYAEIAERRIGNTQPSLFGSTNTGEAA